MPQINETVAIMQPYFFPYIGYFSLIKRADFFVFFDTPQYVRHSWMNRNRIRHPNPAEESNYITLPLKKAAQNESVNNIRIMRNLDWRDKFFGQLEIYKKIAPYYTVVTEVLRNTLSKDYEMLSDLTVNTTVDVCRYIGIPLNYGVLSRMNLNYEPVQAPDEWALNITKALGYKNYVNAIGGKFFFDTGKYIVEGVKIEFLRHRLPHYNQKRDVFIPGLSIIDVMMFCSPEEIRDMADDYEVI